MPPRTWWKVPRWAASGAWLACAALAAGCAGEHPQSTFRPVSDFAATLEDLYYEVFLWTLVVLVVVEAVLVYVVVRYRRRPGQPPPPKLHGHVGLELAWTLIPAVIVAFIAVPSIRAVFRSYRPAGPDAVVVEAIGHQWWWEFRYPQYGVVTANQFRLPVGRPVEVRLSSADVLHNFWIPRVAGKRYNYPTVRRPQEAPRYNELAFTIAEPGEYPGQCAEFCGTAHAIMRMRLVAQPADSFEAWVRAMKTPVEPPPGSLAERGRQIFLGRVCVACHTIEGTPARGILGPNLTRFGERWSVGAGALPNTPENVAAWIRDPQAIKPGARMPGARRGAAGMPPTGLSEEEIRAVAAYLTSLR